MKDPKYKDRDVWVCAPEWVDTGLKKLDQYVKIGTKLDIRDEAGNKTKMKINKELTPILLQIIARNEGSNTSGNVNYSLYGQLSKRQDVILSIRDLVRQTIIFGPDWATHKGGYPKKASTVKQVVPPVPVMLIDLIGLQFQQPHNTGRLVCKSVNERDL